MKAVIWVFVLGVGAGLGYWFWSWRRRRADLKRASEERFATFMAQALVAGKAKKQPAVDPVVAARQRALLEAAAKAGEAGEPVLSIQLYARLIARYPDSSFAAQARAAVEQQKKKLAKA
jgi:hypothetical protein